MKSLNNTRKSLLSLALVSGGALLGLSHAPATLASDWTFCSKEKQTCAFDGEAEVRYGKNDSWNTATFEDGVYCGNANFGDPLPGTFKRCEYRLVVAEPVIEEPVVEEPVVEEPIVVTTPPSDWVFCSKEKSSCEFDGTAEVRYGASGSYNIATFTDGAWCGNANFGDPAPGTFKSCYIRQLTDDTAGTGGGTEEPTTPPVTTPTESTLSVSWDIPMERSNGETLYPYELAGYQLQYKLTDDADFTSVTIGDGLQTELNLELPKGTYHVRIKAIDTDGLSSEFSDIEELAAL